MEIGGANIGKVVFALASAAGIGWVLYHAVGDAAGVKTLHLSPSDRGLTISASPGDLLVAQLPGNPATGYRWIVSEKPSCFEPSADTFGDGNAEPQLQSITFKLIAACNGKLVLQYRRPWQAGSVDAANDFSVDVRVSPKH